MNAVLELLTPRRLVTTAVLLLAIVLIVVGFQRTDTSTSVACGNPKGPIVKLLPCPGDSDLNQGLIGVDMSPGWQVDLSVDGTPIPKDQVTTEGSNFSFQPISGSATGALKPGNHSAEIVYYPDLASASSGRTYSWS